MRKTWSLALYNGRRYKSLVHAPDTEFKGYILFRYFPHSHQYVCESDGDMPSYSTSFTMKYFAGQSVLFVAPQAKY